MTTQTDPLMDRYCELAKMIEIPSMAEYAIAWQKLAADAHAQERYNLAAMCAERAKYYGGMEKGSYEREIIGSFSTIEKTNLEKLIDDCLAMDITNQILTFGDAFLPNKAAEEYRRLKGEKTTGSLLENIPTMDPAKQDR